MRKLSVWRIDKFAKTVGEAALSSTLSSFSVPLNSEVEDFIRNKALQATKLLEFYNANGFKSWNGRYDKKDKVQYDQMIHVIESVA